MPTWIITVVLVGLIGCWTWVLGPSLLRTVFSRAHRDPVGHFSRQLNTLGQAPRSSAAMYGRPIAGGNSVRQRRRQVLLALVIAAVVSAGLALVAGGIFVAQNLLLDVALVGYVVAAARAGSAEAERRNKVAYIGAPNESLSPAYARTGTGRR
ncbi:MAG: hypothetical protein R2706_10775 [Acidimicrobiales bacterium]